MMNISICSYSFGLFVVSYCNNSIISSTEYVKLVVYIINIHAIVILLLTTFFQNFMTFWWISPTTTINHILFISLFAYLVCLATVEMPRGGVFFPVERDIDVSILWYALLSMMNILLRNHVIVLFLWFNITIMRL